MRFLVGGGVVGSPARHLRHMHYHFACAVWRWLDGSDAWLAEMHIKFAVTHLELAREGLS